MPVYNLKEYQTDNVGGQHWYVKQTQAMSCGPACMAMIVERKFGIKVEDKTMQNYSKMHDQTVYDPKKGDVNFQQNQIKDPLKKKGNLNTKAYNVNDGTSAGNMCVMLKKMMINTKPEVSGHIISLLENASYSSPLICQVKYGNNLLHWVVVDGVAGPKIAVCDPAYGLTEIPFSTTYQDKGGKTAKFTGIHIKC